MKNIFASNTERVQCNCLVHGNRKYLINLTFLLGNAKNFKKPENISTDEFHMVCATTQLLFHS